MNIHCAQRTACLPSQAEVPADSVAIARKDASARVGLRARVLRVQHSAACSRRLVASALEVCAATVPACAGAEACCARSRRAGQRAHCFPVALRQRLAP